MFCNVSVLGTEWGQKDAWQMGAGVGDEVRITGQKCVHCTTLGLSSVGKPSAGFHIYLLVPISSPGLPWNYTLALVVIFTSGNRRAFPRKHVSKLNL